LLSASAKAINVSLADQNPILTANQGPNNKVSAFHCQSEVSDCLAAGDDLEVITSFVVSFKDCPTQSQLESKTY
jgi:hypothetical protein